MRYADSQCCISFFLTTAFGYFLPSAAVTNYDPYAPDTGHAWIWNYGC